jgi:hypothetical protein
MGTRYRYQRRASEAVCLTARREVADGPPERAEHRINHSGKRENLPQPRVYRNLGVVINPTQVRYDEGLVECHEFVW